jgi:hypothetical protein
MWVELWAKARMQTPAQVRKELAKIDGVEIVEVQLIDRGEGRAQSKQLELFKQIYL